MPGNLLIASDLDLRTRQGRSPADFGWMDGWMDGASCRFPLPNSKRCAQLLFFSIVLFPLLCLSSSLGI